MEDKVIAYMGCLHERNRGTAPLTVNLGAKWSWAVCAALWPLYPLKRTAAPIELDAGWAPEMIWTFRETRKHSSTGIRPRSSTVASRWLSLPLVVSDWRWKYSVVLRNWWISDILKFQVWNDRSVSMLWWTIRLLNQKVQLSDHYYCFELQTETVRIPSYGLPI
jgi:hypothetical protein